MPSWSSRLLSTPSSSSSNATHSSQATPHGDTQRSATIPIDYTVPVIDPLHTPPGPTPHRRTHARSLSHPFPSILPSGAKKSDKKIAKQDFLDSDDDDEVTYVPEPRSSSPRKRWTPAEDFVSGKCMTCNSTVRWPRNLKVFRCTVCLTVNDLEPCPGSYDPPLDHGHPPPPPPPPKDDSSKTTLPATPLSIERTRAIIDHCLSVYLRSKLDGRQHPSSAPLHRFPEKSSVQQHTTDHSEPWRSPAGPGPITSPTKRQDSRFLMTPSMDTQRKDPRARSRSSSDTPPVRRIDRSPQGRDRSPHGAEHKGHPESRPSIFRPLEEYIISSFTGCDCLNMSFLTLRPSHRTASESNPVKTNPEPSSQPNSQDAPVFELDAKTLLLGDVAENSSWWMGGRPRPHETKDPYARDKSPAPSKNRVTSRSPRIEWAELAEWYRLVINAGDSWRDMWAAMAPSDTSGQGSERRKRWESVDLAILEKEISEARIHTQRTLLKATENLLKRPRRPLQRPENTRFLLMLLANPLLFPATSSQTQRSGTAGPPSGEPGSITNFSRPYNPVDHNSGRRGEAAPAKSKSGGPGHHSGIIKRILGLISNLPNDCHHYLISWFSRYSEGQFEKLVNLVGGFVTYRLMRQHGQQRSETAKPSSNGLIPSLPDALGNTHAAQLHAALNGRSPSKPSNDGGRRLIVYSEDWQIRAAARVMALLFAANNSNIPRKRDGILHDPKVPNPGLAAKQHAYNHGQMIPISSFYNTLLDYSDLVADFETWESRNGKFSFCQYPFFLSIYAKIRILEYDARRQMEIKAREAFFDSILSRKTVSQYLLLRVRRDCLVEDSLRGVSEVVGSGPEEVKKGLRIEFIGEEGVDAGGLRKEWFLLLVREVFDPNHGLFIYDDDSRFCYFNPFCFESSEQFFLVGVLLGLAIYNSTILDVALPPFAFKKLLTSAPPSSVSSSMSTSRNTYTCTLEDLAEYRPALARGLRALLEFDGDVQETFCYDFVAQIDCYGRRVDVPLCPGGEKRPVTNANRHEFVNLYVQYLLDTAVQKQFEPFKRGFFTVCGGNALSLFRPEEIELLVRGSDEPLDVASLRAVATYENWPSADPESEPAVRWFWDFFAESSAQDQRKILSFITGSDRIPAMGATSLSIRISCLGEDSARYPIARTCFNTLGLFRYSTRQKLECKLWGAVMNSEGFGLK